MKNHVGRTAAVLAALLVVTACADDAARDPITGPSLRRNGGETATVQCTGVLPPGTYNNVMVPEGATCTINGSTITGNVLAKTDSRLFMSTDEVWGFIKGDGADIVHIIGTTVLDQVFLWNGTLSGGGGVLNVHIVNTVVTGGNVHVENMTADIISIVDTRVDNGSIEVIDNVTETLLQTEFNQVSQNVDVFRNTGAGPKFVSQNTAGVAVRCFDNTGAFIVGGPNFAPSRQGQCF